MANDSWPTKNETTIAVAKIIKETVFNEDWEDTSTDELCRSAAIAIINHLACVYDEAMKNEPPDVDA